MLVKKSILAISYPEGPGYLSASNRLFRVESEDNDGGLDSLERLGILRRSLEQLRPRLSGICHLVSDTPLMNRERTSAQRSRFCAVRAPSGCGSASVPACSTILLN
jgi:hypothetical protein